MKNAIFLMAKEVPISRQWKAGCKDRVGAWSFKTDLTSFSPYLSAAAASLTPTSVMVAWKGQPGLHAGGSATRRSLHLCRAAGVH